MPTNYVFLPKTHFPEMAHNLLTSSPLFDREHISPYFEQEITKQQFSIFCKFKVLVFLYILSLYIFWIYYFYMFCIFCIYIYIYILIAYDRF